jgi:hypothetical protein
MVTSRGVFWKQDVEPTASQNGSGSLLRRHLLLVVALWGLWPNVPALAGEPLRVGFATADITPPVGYRKGGGYSEVISTGVADPLQAKAMALEQGGVGFAIVVCDLLSVPEPLSRPMREETAKRIGIPAANIVIAATHNHGSPEYWGPLRDIFHERDVRERGGDARESMDYPKLLTRRCVEVLVAAWSNRAPATMELVTAQQTGLAFNRRYHLRDGSVRFNPGKLNPDIVRPAGPVDTDLPWLLVRRAEDRQAIGSLAVFAMHVAVFGGTQFGADFPGYLQRELRRDFGGKFVSIFGEGTAGDVNHVNTATRDPDPSPEQIGARLAATLRASTPLLRPVQDPSLAVRSQVARASFQKVNHATVERGRKLIEEQKTNRAEFLQLVAAWRDWHRWDIEKRHGDTKPLEVQAVRLNRDTALVLLPHEVFVEIGMTIKSASPFRHTLVLSLANDVDYYVPTRRAFEEGSYEVTTCPLNPGCGELLAQTAVRLLKELKP